MNNIEKFLEMDYWVQGRLLPRKILTKLSYYLTRVSRPKYFVRKLIEVWIENYQIDMNQYVIPKGGYKTFNQFHLRELKENTRIISNESVVFPCDCKLTDVGVIDENIELKIKGNRYSLTELVLGDLEENAKEMLSSYRNGTFLVMYLPLSSYHWWHSPIDGNIQSCEMHEGKYYTVTEKAQRLNKQLYVKNHRLVERYMATDTGQENVLLVAVAATFAGTILSEYTKNSLGKTKMNLNVRKGEKMGGFTFGSSIILLLDNSYALSSNIESGNYYKLGQGLARRKNNG